MRTSRRASQLFIFIALIVLIVTLHKHTLPYIALSVSEVGGFEESTLDYITRPLRHGNPHKELTKGDEDNDGQDSRFRPGIPKAPGSEYSRALVVPRTKSEDIGWVAEELPGLDLSVYIVDEPDAALHPPKNKGHEVMVYLSYIVDHYYNLPDIILFMHAHRWTYHNEELLDADAAQMIRRLNYDSVVREGFINLRCAWVPGCPQWLYFNSSEDVMGKQEETYLTRSWKELFPLEPHPPYLAQPCCAQFAVSAQRIHAIPQSRFAFYRDWMMKTPLTDYISGRIMEYSWQYIFTGKGAICPAEHICLCDTFSICFGGSTQYNNFVQLEERKKELESDLAKWEEAGQSSQTQTSNGTFNTTTNATAPDKKHWELLREQIRSIEKERHQLKEKAMARGDNPRLRAEECGRPWKDGAAF